ncbi:MAG: (d)CMP kinase [Candidatus Omnitrophota bacterium]|nr:MAG: (d)CMP kinase [Candidatus Omnitrophota bacterium]
MIIAIDGPAGSGKTTVSRLLAKQLGISYLDTGALYRVLTLKALEENINLNDGETLQKLASTMNVKIEGERIYLDDREVTVEIRTPLIDKNISQVASHPQVREVMVNLQRKITYCKDYVVEGRDITTVVFPHADYKFYLDADFNERLQRRYKELKEKGLSVSWEHLEEQLRKRDEADFTRKVAPLKKAEDAIYIDTTNLTLSEVVNKLLSYIKKKTIFR